MICYDDDVMISFFLLAMSSRQSMYDCDLPWRLI